MEERHHLPWKRRKHLMHLFPSQEHFKNVKFLLQNSEGTMIEVICQPELIIKVLLQSLSGKYPLKLSIIIIICPFSSMDSEKDSILIDLLLFWVQMISLTREEVRFCQLFLSSSFPSKVFSLNNSAALNTRDP